MKRLVTFLCCILVSSFLVGCGNEENNGGIIDFSELLKPKTEIRVWIDDEKGEYVEELIEEFNKIEPNILVTHQHMGTEDSREKLKTFGPSGNGADVWQLPHDNLAVAISENLVLGLADDVKDRLEETIHELGISIGKVNYNEATNTFGNGTEKLYGVAQSLETLVLLYNKDLIVGEPADTFEQIYNEALTYMENNNQFYLGQTSYWANSYMLQFAFSAFGFYPFGENLDDASKVGFDSDEAQNAIRWIYDYIKPITTGEANHDSGSATVSFETGELPYIISGPWMFETFSEKLGDSLGVTTLPSINGIETEPFTGAIMNSVYKYTKYPEESTKFVEFMSSEKGMELLYKHKGKLPALKTELLPEAVKNDEYLNVVYTQMESAVPMPTIPSSASYWGPAESMLTAVWGTHGSITDEAIRNLLKEAEEGYKAAENLRTGN